MRAGSRVFRFDIDLAAMAAADARMTVSAPPGKVLLVDVQQRAPGLPCLWLEVPLDEPPVDRVFEVVGTGHDVPEGGVHVGSWQQEGFVWHLYEVSGDAQ